MKCKNIILLFLVMLLNQSMFAQNTYQNYYKNWNYTKILPSWFSGGGGGGLTVEIKDDILTVNFSAGFSAFPLKVGSIDYLETSPRLPDMQLGVISGSYTAYLQNGALYISSTQNESLSSVSKKFTVQLSSSVQTNVQLSDSENYIYTTIPQEAVTSISEKIESKNVREINYFDGLGRVNQVLQVAASPDQKDLVQPVVYDNLGRQNIEYLPYEAAIADVGEYKSKAVDFHYSSSCEHRQFYTNSNNSIAYDNNAYYENLYDNSPLNRVTKMYDPGEDWRSHPVQMEYHTNNSYEVLSFQLEDDVIKNEEGDLSGGLYYHKAHQLYKTVTKDENWQSSHDNLHTVEEYKDKLGQVVLKRTYVEDGSDSDTNIDVVDTYYVYDDFGLLRYVIPPQALRNMLTGQGNLDDVIIVNGDISLSRNESGVNKYVIEGLGSVTLTDGFRFTATSGNSLSISPESLSNDMCYSYQYDYRRRMIMKKIPGAEPILMVYDNRNRLVLTQDGNQREDDNWMYTLYDALNRPLETGLINTTATFESLQQSVGSSNNYVPSGRTIYSNTWYDNYVHGADCIGFDASKDISGTSYMTVVKGQVTGSKERVFGTDEESWVTTTNYYDKNYCVIQTQQKLVLKEGSNTTVFSDCISNKYDFVGKVERSVQVHDSDKISTAQTIDNEYTYDHAGRLVKVEQSLSGAINKTKTEIANMTYDELGQLKSKTFHGGQQAMNYKYNIRGWMESINDPNNMGSSMFAMKLLYNNTSEISGVSNQAQYNGNIGGILWRSINTSGALSSLRAYGYTYDALNRVKTADYEEKSSSWTNVSKFDVTGNDSGIAYDLNGNIENLKRYDSGTGTKDHFNYRYVGNQLIALGENGSAAPLGNEFSYDANGNMIANTNKRISSLKYNALNLPESMIVDTKSVKYNYTAGGRKIKNDVDGKKLYYIGNFVYEDSSLKYILHDEGRFVVNQTENGGSFEYHLKDHLGNIRVAFQENQSNPIQSTDYYPFGLTMNMSDGSSNEYLYNGKELQEETDWLDYGARMYDASLGRFFTQDRFAEEYYGLSAYQYTANNPILFIDVNGDYIFINGEDNKRYKYENGELYSKDKNGDWKEYKAKAGSYLSVIQGALNKLASEKDGNALVDFFAGEKNHVNIRQRKKGEAGSGNKQSGWSIITDKKPQGGIIPTEGGLQKSPLYVAIGHEMAHRQDRIKGTFSMKPWYKINGIEIPEAEKYATHYENMIRAEQELPLRTHYSRDNTKGNGPAIIKNGKSSFYRLHGVAFDYNYRVHRRKFILNL